MKERKRNVPVQFWVSPAEAQKINQNMERNGMTNLSEFMRVLALSNADITFSVRMPNVVQVSEAHLSPGAEEERSRKRAAGQ